MLFETHVKGKMSISYSRLLLIHRSCQLIHRNSLFTTAVCQATAFKGAPSVGKKRFRLPVRDNPEDAEYLCKYVSGSNIYKTGEDIMIKDDSEYPDWLWSIPLHEVKLEELDPASHEYWQKLEDLALKRRQMNMNMKPKEIMVVDPHLKERILYNQRLKHRALAAEDSEDYLGFNPSDYIAKYDKKFWLKPQESLHEEEILPDEFVKKEPYKVMRPTRPDDWDTARPTSKIRERKMMNWNIYVDYEKEKE